ncbi:MAG: type IV toxin-antitoxin system AbiEi family antitoxin domain-containing protein [Oligoflexia bacterium]|nr:type IV toxin-antitoxin system AbiEi family antitoxin domain-containing protein [Oligoflexia bacterium]
MKEKGLKIDILRKSKESTFTARDALKHKLSHQHLEYYLRKGVIQRIAHGVYLFADKQSVDFEFLIKEKLAAFPNAIVGLRTALRLYDLIEELPECIDLLVPSENTPKKKMEDVTLHRVKSCLLRKGITDMNGIPVTTLERTIIDLLRKKESLSFVLQVINEAKKKGLIIETTKLKKLAVGFRIKNSLELLFEVWMR